MMLREVDHRVMNSFQLLSSLLALQRRGAKDPAAVHELELVEQRVHALALVHTRLHQSGGLTDVDVGPYLTELVRDLGSSMLHDAAQSQLVVHAVSAVLPVQSATALGMISAELITNAVKHAGPNNPSTEIHVVFERTDAGTLRLSVRDNGHGLPPDFDPSRSSGLGMRLVHVLARQLGAKFHLAERRAGRRVQSRSGGRQIGTWLGPSGPECYTIRMVTPRPRRTRTVHPCPDCDELTPNQRMVLGRGDARGQADRRVRRDRRIDRRRTSRHAARPSIARSTG